MCVFTILSPPRNWLNPVLMLLPHSLKDKEIASESWHRLAFVLFWKLDWLQLHPKLMRQKIFSCNCCETDLTWWRYMTYCQLCKAVQTRSTTRGASSVCFKVLFTELASLKVSLPTPSAFQSKSPGKTLLRHFPRPSPSVRAQLPLSQRLQLFLQLLLLLSPEVIPTLTLHIWLHKMNTARIVCKTLFVAYVNLANYSIRYSYANHNLALTLAIPPVAGTLLNLWPPGFSHWVHPTDRKVPSRHLPASPSHCWRAIETILANRMTPAQKNNCERPWGQGPRRKLQAFQQLSTEFCVCKVKSLITCSIQKYSLYIQISASCYTHSKHLF